VVVVLVGLMMSLTTAMPPEVVASHPPLAALRLPAA